MTASDIWAGRHDATGEFAAVKEVVASAALDANSQREWIIAWLRRPETIEIVINLTMAQSNSECANAVRMVAHMLENGADDYAKDRMIVDDPGCDPGASTDWLRDLAAGRG